MRTVHQDVDDVVELASSDISVLANQDVIITGASGFVGKWLVGPLAKFVDESGSTGRIVLTCRDPNRILHTYPGLTRNRRFQLVSSDVRSFTFPEGFEPETIIHCATAASEKLNRENPRAMWDTIVRGTENVLEQARLHGSKRVVLLSSGAIYGMNSKAQQAFIESDTSGPSLQSATNAYHEGKRAMEMLGEIYASQFALDVLRLRLFTFMGPYLAFDTHFAAGNFIADAVNRRAIKVKSSGMSVRSYQYPTDLARSIFAASARRTTHKVFNVGSGNPVSILQLATTVRDVVNNRLEVEREFHGVNEGQESFYVPDVSLIEAELGIVNHVDLRESIDRTARWVKLVCSESSN